MPASLTSDAIAKVQKRAGVYELKVDGSLVYVGKASKSLPTRLAHHARKLSGRRGLERGDVRFICLYVDEDLEASAPEKLLIKRYRALGEAPWNTNGFGNKDPGRERDTSSVASNHFDALYPINLDLPIDLAQGERAVSEVLADMKRLLPYLVRYESPRKSIAAHNAYRSSVVLPYSPITARDIIERVVAALPSGWQATALPGYVILYHEMRDYASATKYWRSGPTGVEMVEGEQELGPPIEIREVDDVAARDDVEDADSLEL